MHVSVLLAGASIAIAAMSESDVDSYTKSKQYFGVILLPISIAFILYAMMQCECICTRIICLCFVTAHTKDPFLQILDARRASIIRRASPGPWQDLAGPLVLSVVLVVSLVSQFALKLYSLM